MFVFTLLVYEHQIILVYVFLSIWMANFDYWSICEWRNVWSAVGSVTCSAMLIQLHWALVLFNPCNRASLIRWVKDPWSVHQMLRESLCRSQFTTQNCTRLPGIVSCQKKTALHWTNARSLAPTEAPGGIAGTGISAPSPESFEAYSKKYENGGHGHDRFDDQRSWWGNHWSWIHREKSSSPQAGQWVKCSPMKKLKEPITMTNLVQVLQISRRWKLSKISFRCKTLLLVHQFLLVFATMEPHLNMVQSQQAFTRQVVHWQTRLWVELRDTGWCGFVLPPSLKCCMCKTRAARFVYTKSNVLYVQDACRSFCVVR